MTRGGGALSSAGVRGPVAAIWDLDGLLVDTIPLHRECWRYVLEEEGFLYDDAAMRRVSGCRDWEIVQALLDGQVKDPSEDMLTDLVLRKQALFSECLAEGVALHEGVREWLDHFAKAGYRQAVASSTTRHNIDLVISSAGLRGYFQVVLSAETDVKRGKPAPDLFLLASQRLGTDPARCVVLEDSSVGVMAAKAAGMYCVAVANTQPVEDLRAADLVVTSLAAVSPEICDRWLGVPSR